jgi:glycosyltransferase involved in cell wall biosynthesis
MHILLIHQAFVTTGDAGGTRHYEIARFLAEKGHRITVITSRISYLTGENKSEESTQKEEKALNKNIRIIFSYTSSGMHKGFLSRLFAFLSFMVSSFFTALSVPGVDIVWGTSPNLFQAFTAWLSARCKHSRFLFEIRDLWPDFAVELGILTNPILITCSRILEKFLYRHSDLLVVNSPGFIDHIQKASGKKPVLIPNGSDPDMFVSGDDGEAFRHKYHLENSFVVMYSGAHGPANDLDVVLDAAELLLDHPGICFVFVGSGKDKPRLEQSALERNLKNVIFAPPVSKNRIAEVLAAADAGLAILKPVALFKTTYPNKVFDTMASGKPVLCQIDGVIREVVEKYDAGIFIEPGSPDSLVRAVELLAADPDRCQQMGETGRKAICEHFSREQSSFLMEKMLQSMLK